MKAEADRQATPSHPHMHQSQMDGSVLHARSRDDDKGQARALLDRVRAIRDDPQQQRQHSYQSTNRPYMGHDRSTPRDYERPRWQPSSSGEGSRDYAYDQPPSYLERSEDRHRSFEPHHQPHSYPRRDDAHEPMYREAHHSRRYGYDDVDNTRRSHEYAGPTTGSAGYHDQQNHYSNQLSPPRTSDHRPRPAYGYGHGVQGSSNFLPSYAYPPSLPRREGGWRREPPREIDEFSYRAPVVTIDAVCPLPHSYAQPMLENLPERRTSNPSTSPAFHHHPNPRTSADGDYHHHRQHHRLERDERVVVRHHVRSPPLSKPLRQAHEVSSYQSTSNSSAQSFVSNEDDDELEHREEDDESEADDDSEDDIDADEDNDYNDYIDVVANPRRHTLRFSKLLPEIYEDNELHSDFHHTIHMIIPANAFGCLIGNGGAIIRKINAQTRCTLSIRDPDSFSIKEDRVLRIYGKAKGICLAQQLVIERIRAHRTKMQDPNYMPLFHGCDGSDFLLLPSLPDSSITRSMNDAVAELARKGRNNSESTDRPVGSLKWLVPSDNVGKIMGTAGAILAAIGRESNTKIHVTPTHEMPRGTKERTVTIFGAPENIEAARQVIEMQAGGRVHTSNAKCGQYFAIPHTSAGALIGVKGNVARRITEQSGARLQIPHHDHLPLGSVNRSVHLQGNKQQVEAAYALVCSTVRADLAAIKSSETPTPGMYLVIKIIVSTRHTGLLLKHSGRLIREIAEKTGAHAYFMHPLENETRVCVIKGFQSDVFRAERLVLQCLAGELIATKKSGVGTQGILPREKRKRRVVDSDDDEEVDDEDGDYEAPSKEKGRRERVVQSGTVRRGGRNETVTAYVRGRRTNLHGTPDNRQAIGNSNKREQTEKTGRQNGKSRGSQVSADREPDIIDRLQAPLQSARAPGNPNKRQRQ